MSPIRTRKSLALIQAGVTSESLCRRATRRRTRGDRCPTQHGALEPIDIYADAALVLVAAFEHAWQLKEAAVTLAAGRLEPFIPRLIPRGTNLCGTGRRFFLRVEQADADEARQVLKEAEDEDSDPRCMRCGSERVVRNFGFWQYVLDLAFISIGTREFTLAAANIADQISGFSDALAPGFNCRVNAFDLPERILRRSQTPAPAGTGALMVAALLTETSFFPYVRDVAR